MSGITGLLGSAPGVVNLPANVTGGSVGSSGSVGLETDGDVVENGADANDWVAPKTSTIGDHYQVIFRNVTGDTGSLSGASTETWLDLSSNRTWTLAAGNLSVSGTIAVREKNTAIERDSCPATITNTT